MISVNAPCADGPKEPQMKANECHLGEVQFYKPNGWLVLTFVLQRDRDSQWVVNGERCTHKVLLTCASGYWVITLGT